MGQPLTCLRWKQGLCELPWAKFVMVLIFRISTRASAPLGDQARNLFEKLDRLSLDRENVILLTWDEIQLLKNAHEQTLSELGSEEYATRTGVKFPAGQPLLNELLGLARS